MVMAMVTGNSTTTTKTELKTSMMEDTSTVLVNGLNAHLIKEIHGELRTMSSQLEHSDSQTMKRWLSRMTVKAFGLLILPTLIMMATTGQLRTGTDSHICRMPTVHTFTGLMPTAMDTGN